MGGSTSHVFHDKDNLRICLDSIKQSRYVRMIKPLHELNLAPYRLLSLQVLHLFFLIDFESHFLVVASVDSDMNCCIGTLTDLLANHVVFHRMIIREDNHLFLLLLFLNDFDHIWRFLYHDHVWLSMLLCLIVSLHELCKILRGNFSVCRTRHEIFDLIILLGLLLSLGCLAIFILKQVPGVNLIKALL